MAALPAMAASAQGGFARPKIIMAPRFVPRAAARPGGHEFGRDRLAGRRFRDRRGGAGLDDGEGAYPVPVPVGGGEPPAGSPPEAAPEDYGSGYRAPAPSGLGPQIITLPDAPRGSVAARGARAFRAGHIASRRHEGARSFAPAFGPYAHRYHRRPAFGFGERYGYRRSYSYAPAYWPSSAYDPSPVALAPCCDAAYAPIYNTPCGVRPYW
jgi:hypothetical protein